MKLSAFPCLMPGFAKEVQAGFSDRNDTRYDHFSKPNTGMLTVKQ